MPSDTVTDQAHRRTASYRAARRVCQIVARCLIVIATLCMVMMIPANPEPYHTSILSSQMWVDELLEGHPDRIYCELSVRREIFLELVHTLHNFGITGSKHVSLEEQLSIFLYMSMTGLTICHTGERLQRSNNMISKSFRKMLFIFSSAPFYTTYVTLPNADTPPS